MRCDDVLLTQAALLVKMLEGGGREAATISAERGATFLKPAPAEMVAASVLAFEVASSQKFLRWLRTFLQVRYNLRMTAQEIRRLRERQPFEPFRIMSAHDEKYDVKHPENIAITGNGRLIAVAMPDYVATLDLLLVTEIKQPIPGKKNGTRRKTA